MNGIGTDVVALAAILGSAAVGGAVTMAALDRTEQPAVAECLTTSVVAAPNVVVRSGHSAHSIVIAPSAHVHAARTCVGGVGAVVVEKVVQKELDRAQADLERAMEALEQNRMELAEFYQQDIGRRLEEEMARLEEELARLEVDVGR